MSTLLIIYYADVVKVSNLDDLVTDMLVQWTRIKTAMRSAIQSHIPAEHMPCPICFTTETNRLFVAFDGNFQHRRLRSAGVRADTMNSESIPSLFIPSVPVENDLQDNPTKCTSHFKATSSGSKANAFASTGFMLAVCKHDIPIRLLSIEGTGERMCYARAMLLSIMEEPKCPWYINILYDVGCQFESHCRKHLEGTIFSRLTFGVAAFHAFAHSYSCQLRYAPRYVPTFGLADGEGCERIWSATRHLIPSGRYMSGQHRLEQFNNICLYIKEDKLLKMGGLLVQRWKKAYGIYNTAGILLRELDTINEDYLHLHGYTTEKAFIEAQILNMRTFYTQTSSIANTSELDNLIMYLRARIDLTRQLQLELERAVPDTNVTGKNTSLVSSIYRTKNTRILQSKPERDVRFYRQHRLKLGRKFGRLAG